MSTVRFIGLRCDQCKKPLMNGTTGDAYFAPTVSELHHVARLRRWKCRAWTKDKGQVDCCPDCVPAFVWGSPLAKEKTA